MLLHTSRAIHSRHNSQVVCLEAHVFCSMLHLCQAIFQLAGCSRQNHCSNADLDRIALQQIRRTQADHPVIKHSGTMDIETSLCSLQLLFL